ncbi:MAG: rubrerythrin [candidate division Zixibacteria bacterium]|nr:rubrerythrin [candidate division Zixibacteria bacterium]
MKAWRQFLSVFLFLPLIIPGSFVDAQPKYPKTIDALQERYVDEIHGVHRYLAYAQKAISEDYPNIAYLFVAFAASESIHARNLKGLLVDLGVQVNEIPKPEFRVSTTQDNLNKAATVEIEEIDYEYPRLIEYIKPEKHGATIQSIIYAWKAEEQHRDLLKKVLSGTGVFFGLLAEKIERTSLHFYVDQGCGSILTHLPKDVCPICKGPVVQYNEVERIR